MHSSKKQFIENLKNDLERLENQKKLPIRKKGDNEKGVFYQPEGIDQSIVDMKEAIKKYS